MKFKPKAREVKIPWKEGAITHWKFPLMQDLIRNKNIAREVSKKMDGVEDSKEVKNLNYAQIGIESFEQSFIGFEGIQNDDTGEPLENTEEIRAQLFSAMLQEKEMCDKIVTAFKGISGNSNGGLTVPSSTDGVQENASNATEPAKKKEPASTS